MTQQNHLIKQLEQIIDAYPNTLKAEVASEALQCSGSIENYFSDLFVSGCQSGMVSSLIYYSDTHAFYDKYYHEIEDIRFELIEAMDAPLEPVGDLKNWYAWLAFEETARHLAEELDIDLV